MVCSLVQSGTKFTNVGCPNCEEFLEMRGSQDTVADCTSQVFEGMITVTGEEGSWVARWQRLEGYKPGIYAVKVVGVVSLSPVEGFYHCTRESPDSDRDCSCLMTTSSPPRTQESNISRRLFVFRVLEAFP